MEFLLYYNIISGSVSVYTSWSSCNCTIKTLVFSKSNRIVHSWPTGQTLIIVSLKFQKRKCLHLPNVRHQSSQTWFCQLCDGISKLDTFCRYEICILTSHIAAHSEKFIQCSKKETFRPETCKKLFSYWCASNLFCTIVLWSEFCTWSQG